MLRSAFPAPAVALLLLALAPPAGATRNRLLLFGGPDYEDFLGCVTCDAGEPFSIWNPESEYGSPTSRLSIWNREGPYGSQDSPYSPWSRRPGEPLPVVVDRAGNLCGKFVVDRSAPGRVTDGYLVWLLEGHDWIADHLDEVREDFRGQSAEVPACGLPPRHTP
jgi:hypothetical protein